jgi:hypothetical protein
MATCTEIYSQTAYIIHIRTTKETSVLLYAEFGNQSQKKVETKLVNSQARALMSFLHQSHKPIYNYTYIPTISKNKD